MAAGRYQAQRATVSLAALLTYLLLKQDPPIRLPGKRGRRFGSGACKVDGGEIVKNGSGKYVCQKCGKVYPSLPKR
jgi:hypothetical protein